jgi:predicted anti-sigma-YlaC factor YlaD
LDGAAIPVAADAMPYLPLLCDAHLISADDICEPLRTSAGLRALLDELLRRDALYVDVDF